MNQQDLFEEVETAIDYYEIFDTFFGTDHSKAISLVEYNVLYSTYHQTLILHKDGMFDVQHVTLDEIAEVVGDMPPGFYSWLGTDEETYRREAAPQHAIYDTLWYYGHWWPSSWHIDSVEELVEVLK